MAWLDSNWCELSWTPWVKFSGQRSDWRKLPGGSGVYRVRPVGQRFLMYVGQTGRSLRGRLHDLQRNTLADLMPYDDPHTAAPNLWAWRQEERWDYECSAAPTTLSEKDRKAVECYLLWQYRLERKESTLCNHGRFHKDYKKSGLRATGFRGGRLSAHDERNPSGGRSHYPLEATGEPSKENWMGLKWTEISPFEGKLDRIPNGAGLYKLRLLTEPDLLYIGETMSLRVRLTAHQRRYREKREVSFSYVPLQEGIHEYELRELENDLLGAYYAFARTAPQDQFGRAK